MKKFEQRGFFAIVAITIMAMTASLAHADLAAAQKAIDDAKSNISAKSWSDADTNVKLAAAELDGLSDSDKKSVQSQLDSLKQQITDGQAGAGKAEIVEHAEGILADAKKYLTDQPDPEAVLRDANDLDEYLNKDDTKAAIPADQIAKYRAQMAKYKTVASAKNNDKQIENVKREYDRMHESFDAQMATIKGGQPGEHASEMDVLGRDLDILHNHLNALPQDNDKVKSMQASTAQMASAFGAVTSSAQADTVLHALTDNWSSYADDYKGWEAENSPPTFEQYSKESGEKMFAFNMPKTEALRKDSSNFLDTRKEDKDYAAVASNPQIKSLVDGITKLHDDASAKLLKAATSLVEGAEKSLINGNNKTALGTLNTGIAQALGEKSPDVAPLQARLTKLSSGFEATTAGAEQGKLDAYKNLKVAATKDWPAMEAKFSPVTGFDPNNYKSFTGKQIKITTDNLMGYRFSPGDFPFATTLNGEPIACRYAPSVKSAVDDVEKKIGRALGDSDDDGKWEIIAVVNGTTGKMMARKQVEGDLKTDNGEKVGTYKGEYSDPVEAPILTIIAAHCGPLAVAANAGEAQAATHSGSWLGRLLLLVVGLLAAAVALLKANFAPLATIPQVGQVQTRVGSNNLALVGLLCAAIGVIWLLMGYIIFGLLVNLGIIAAGGFGALDLLTAKGLIKPDLAAKIRPLGIPIGIACAVLVILELLVQGRFYII